MGKITDLNSLQLGYWWTYCCHLDLKQIENEEDLENIRIELIEQESPIPEVWDSKLSALQEIRTRWQRYPDIQQNEIDPMIKELEI